MVVAAMQGADQNSSLGFSILPKDISKCRPGELNRQPSINNILALPLSHNHISCNNLTIFNILTLNGTIEHNIYRYFFIYSEFKSEVPDFTFLQSIFVLLLM